MTIKTESKEVVENAEVGVIIGRFQLDEPHVGHLELINFVLTKQQNVIIMLGIEKAPAGRKNPLDFANRKLMLQTIFPSVTIIPLENRRYNKDWSKSIDDVIPLIYGNKKTVIYGSRDSFIPHYEGKYPTVELDSSEKYNATNNRLAISRKIINTPDFRAGIIYSIYGQRGRLDSTVDVCGYNENGEILMAKKPNEPLWRFVGGYVDSTDESDEMAARREFNEETECSINDLKYIASRKINDWRMKGSEHNIMTRLFLGRKSMGMPKASDDIVEVKWIHISEFSNFDGIRTKVMVEHRELMAELVNQVYENNLIPNIGNRLEELPNNRIYTIE